MTLQSLDTFTRAYIEAALWSSTEYRYGECPCCGRMALLDRYPELEFEEQAMCSADGCGVREIPNPEPMDKNYSADDMAPETLAKMVEDCAKWQSEHETPSYGHPEYSDAEMAGHDLFLTRCRYGAGFWDRDLGELGDKLSDAARKLGEVWLYVGDDGKIYC